MITLELLYHLFADEYAFQEANYPVIFTALAANTKETKSQTIDRGDDFIPVFIRHLSTGLFRGGLNFVNRDMQNSLIHSTLWGNAQTATYTVATSGLVTLNAIMRIGKSMEMKITAQDISGAPNTIEVILSGVHLIPIEQTNAMQKPFAAGYREPR